MHLHDADPEQLVGLLSLADADALVTESAIRTPSIRIAKDGAVLPESSYTRSATLAGKPLTGLVDPQKAVSLFADGATIVFQGLHRYWAPLTDLIAELELELGHPCQANAYLTPPGSQGFAVHSDTHDVFVFQTHGSKQWEVHTEDGVQDVEMVPGRSMYLPTGTPHAARAQDTVSLHVTVGINQLTWRGLVERSIRRVLDGVSSSHLPAGYLEDPLALADELGRRLEQVAEQIRHTDAQGAVEAEVRRFLTSRPPRVAGGLVDALALDDLADDTRLTRRPGHPCVLLDRGDRIAVLLGDRELEVPAWIRPALEEVRALLEERPRRRDRPRAGDCNPPRQPASCPSCMSLPPSAHA